MLTRRSLLTGMPLLAAPQSSRVQAGCQTNAWPLEEGNFEQLLSVLREMKEIGYHGFECNIRFVKDQFARASSARKAIESTAVRFLGAHTSLEQSQDSDFASRAAGLAALGADRIVMSARGLSRDGRFDDAAVQDKARRLAETARIAKKNGIRIAYHNHNDEFANNNAEIDAIARLIIADELDFLVDAGHAYLGGGDPAKFLNANAKRIFGFHVKTFRGPKEQVPLG